MTRARHETEIRAVPDTNFRDGEEVARFFGSFHEVRSNQRLVQTFTWGSVPDGVSLDTIIAVDLGGQRTRIEELSVVESLQTRDAILASGMETGVVEGYEKLDEGLGR